MGKLDAVLHSPNPPPMERYAAITALETQIGNVSTLEAGRYAEAVRLR